MSYSFATPWTVACQAPLSMGLFFFFFNWRVIALQNFVVFCHTSTRVSHRYTYASSFPDLPPISLPIPTFSLSQSPCLISLSHITISHWLFYIWICKFPCYFLHISHPLPPSLPLCPLVCSLCLFLHCCPENKFISAIFLDSIYLHQHMIFIFLFLTYFTLYNRL